MTDTPLSDAIIQRKTIHGPLVYVRLDDCRKIERELSRWKRAVINALVVAYIYTRDHEADPDKALNDLACWNNDVALDPAVSSAARALQGLSNEAERRAYERGLADGRADSPPAESPSLPVSVVREAVAAARKERGGEPGDYEASISHRGAMHGIELVEKYLTAKLPKSEPRVLLKEEEVINPKMQH